MHDPDDGPGDASRCRIAATWCRCAWRQAGRPLLIAVEDSCGRSFDAAAITDWGGFALDPFAVVEPPGTDKQARWVVDPFAFLQPRRCACPRCRCPTPPPRTAAACCSPTSTATAFPRAPSCPARRWRPRCCCARCCRSTASPHRVGDRGRGRRRRPASRDRAAEMEALARQMFALPHVEIASHTYSHPFHWDQGRTARRDAGRPGRLLRPEGAGLRASTWGARSPARRITSASAWRRAGKPVKVLLWTGDAAPGRGARCASPTTPDCST
ncbi:MAG: hypothetical protein MZV65_43860 [Chromatiales bacterium]|nr:hypothetical protein [Chromatiales bacterium]